MCLPLMCLFVFSVQLVGLYIFVIYWIIYMVSGVNITEIISILCLSY